MIVEEVNLGFTKLEKHKIIEIVGENEIPIQNAILIPNELIIALYNEIKERT